MMESRGFSRIFWTFLGDAESQFGPVGHFVASLGFFKDAWESGENSEESRWSEEVKESRKQLG